MNDKECTQALEEAIEKLEEIKEDVKAFIVLAVTDEENLNGTSIAGVNAINGNGKDLLNLLANLPNELILSTAIAMTHKALESFEKEEEDDEETFAIN